MKITKYFLSMAAAIGMIPRQLAGRAKVIGNAALRGAARLLLSPQGRAQAEAIAGAAVHVPLGGDAAFNNAYMEAMMFE